MKPPGRLLRWWLIVVLALLYAPLLLLVATSFNDSRLLTVWSGPSLRWYGALFADRALIDSAWLSLWIAAVSASIATILGFLAGTALARLGRFALRDGFAGLLTVPLVLPDLLLGLGLLLLFVAAEQWIGVPRGRGAGTIIIAHATLGTAYVSVVVRARLADSGTLLEQAAMDLGQPPLGALFLITLPLCAPALAAGWLLAFTLSLDDVVLASFTAGPGATTLPMQLFSAMHLGATPILNALATLMLAVITLALLLASRLATRRPQPARQDRA